MPVQTSVNSRLRASVGSPLMASMISFAVGTVALIVATTLIDGRALPDFTALPPWLFLGGLFGVVVLTGNILMLPRLGALQTVVLPIVGQMFMGLMIDTFGWYEQPDVALTPGRILGAGLVLLGALGGVGVYDRLRLRSAAAGGAAGASGDAQGAAAWAWRAFGVLCGMLSASQTAVNGRLGTELDSAVRAAAISFTVGVLTLLILVLVTRQPWQFRTPAGASGNPWWMWIGGLLGAALVFINAALAPIIGTGLTVMTTLVGMMAASLVIDQFGLLASRRRPVTALQISGVLVMIAGVALIRL